MADDAATGTPTSGPAREVIYRHTRVVRITHWLNALCLFVLLLSGLQIFNAHPALYWGQKGADFDKPFLEMTATGLGTGRPRGVVRVEGAEFDTTGVFGLSREFGKSQMNGRLMVRGYPSWLTLPSYRDLATGRRWHFFFAWIFVLNGLTYVGFGLWNRHLQRDLAPTKAELAPKHLLHDIVQHAQLKLPKGEAAKRYNVLQKLAYLGVICLLALMVLTGLTMSPGMDAVFPWLVELFGGRQSARTLHWISANLIVLFFLVHLFMVIVAGAVNEIRSMITGRYEIKPVTGRAA
jgi:thiosulfate reductase cytochrome b subunit